MDKDKIKLEINKLAADCDTFIRSSVLKFYLSCVELIEGSTLSEELKTELFFSMKKLCEKSDNIDYEFVRFNGYSSSTARYIDEYVLPHKLKLIRAFLHILTSMGKDAKHSGYRFLLEDVYFADMELFDIGNIYQQNITAQDLFNSKLIRCRSYILDSVDFYVRMNPFLDNVLTFVNMEHSNAKMFIVRRAAEAIEKEIDLVQHLTNYFKSCLFSAVSSHLIRSCLREIGIMDFICKEGCIPYKGNKYVFYQLVPF